MSPAGDLGVLPASEEDAHEAQHELILKFAQDIPVDAHDMLTFVVNRMAFTMGRVHHFSTVRPGFNPKTKYTEEDKVVYLFQYLDNNEVHVSLGDVKEWCR